MPDVTCSCGHPFIAPDYYAGKVMRCPSCGSPVMIPATLESLTAFADEVQEVNPGRGRMARREKAVVCVYCGWHSYDEGFRCPSCGRLNPAFMRVIYIFGVIFGAVILGTVAFAFRTWQAEESRLRLEIIAQKVWEKQKMIIYSGKGPKLEEIQAERGWPSGPSRYWVVEPPYVEVTLWSLRRTGVLRLKANIIEEIGKITHEIKYTIHMTQNYVWDGDADTWVEDGPMEQVPEG
ncbi:MAG: hypothetical protein HYZ53_06490 [Planctomycetes bacterium]|nr:hypothetical protein [Planctomycetota bacterium]